MPRARREGRRRGETPLTPRRLRWALLLLHAATVQAVTAVVRPTASYRALELGVDARWLGALSAGFAVLPLLAAIGVGRVTDRRGERPVLVGGGLVVLGACVAFAVAGTSLPLLIACNAALGFGHLLLMVAEQSLVAGAALERSRDAAFGAYAFAVSAGQAVGPAALAGLGGSRVRPDTGVLFLAGVGAAVLLLAVGLALARLERRAGVARLQPAGAAGGGRLLRLPGLPAAILASLVVVAAVDIVAVYLPALGTERGFAASTVGLLLVLRALTSMVSRLLLGRLVARTGRAVLLLAGAVTAGACLVVLGLPVPLPAVAVAVAVAGVGLGVGQPLTMSLITLLAPPHRRATALSLRLTGNRLGQTAVPAGVGLAAGGVGARAVLATTGVLLAVTTAVAFRRVSRADPQGTRTSSDLPAAAAP